MGNPLLIQQFVEDFAKVLVQAGVPTEAGKIFGWLLACDPPCQTAAEIAQALALDRDLVEQMGSVLVQYGVVDSVSLPDKECFAAKPLDEMVQRRFGLVDGLIKALNKGLEVTKDFPAQQDRLLEYRDLYALMGEELPKIVERWKAGKVNRAEGVPLE